MDKEKEIKLCVNAEMASATLANLRARCAEVKELRDKLIFQVQNVAESLGNQNCAEVLTYILDGYSTHNLKLKNIENSTNVNYNYRKTEIMARILEGYVLGLISHEEYDA